MSSISRPTACPTASSPVVPCLRYRDAPAAIRWLGDAFGFAPQLVVSADDGAIAHAQLSFGRGVIMLGSALDTAYGRLMKQPAEIGHFVTQSTYLVVADADLVYGRAREAGAEILLDIKDEDYGGRGFTCRDPEGHVWSIGTYNPQA